MENLKLTEIIEIDSTEFVFSFARSSGPGGQNVNKVNSKAVLAWDIGQSQSLPVDIKERIYTNHPSKITTKGVMILSSEKYRDQKRNIQDCLDKLHKILLENLNPPKKRKPTKPSKAAKEQRLKEKNQRSEIKKNRSKVRF